MSSQSPKASIQFIQGLVESVVPEITIERNSDGREGKAYFIFNEPETLSQERASPINQIIMTDKEGELTSRDVSIIEKDGKSNSIKAAYSWKSYLEFERFMRFAHNYTKANGKDYLDNKGVN